MISKCQCQHCGGGIEFDAAQFEISGEMPDLTLGQIVGCPHCQKQTTIYVKKTTIGLQAVPRGPREVASSSDEETPLLAYVLAIFLPLIGFFFGIYLMTKKQSGHGCAVMALSILAGLIWMAIFTNIG
jgi:hypothetical protein